MIRWSQIALYWRYVESVCCKEAVATAVKSINRLNVEPRASPSSFAEFPRVLARMMW
jgi:hypothetical protein